MRSDALLEVRDLRVSFEGRSGTVEPVRGTSFSVQAGSFTALVGASGSGKTLTALSLCRLILDAALSGEALFRTKPEGIDSSF